MRGKGVEMRLFAHPSISPEELASLQRVFNILCPTFDRHCPSDEVEFIASTLVALYQNGTKDHGTLLAEMERRGFLADQRRVA
jgi:hypothetical protein